MIRNTCNDLSINDEILGNNVQLTADERVNLSRVRLDEKHELACPVYYVRSCWFKRLRLYWRTILQYRLYFDKQI